MMRRWTCVALACDCHNCERRPNAHCSTCSTCTTSTSARCSASSAPMTSRFWWRRAAARARCAMSCRTTSSISTQTSNIPWAPTSPRGLAFLHKQDLVHGSLTSRTCLIDARWTVKITDWQIARLGALQSDNRVAHADVTSPKDDDARQVERKLFWSAPEVIIARRRNAPAVLTQQADVYRCASCSYSSLRSGQFVRQEQLCDFACKTHICSLGIIIVEIFTREDPFDDVSKDLSSKELVDQILNLCLTWATCTCTCTVNC